MKTSSVLYRPAPRFNDWPHFSFFLFIPCVPKSRHQLFYWCLINEAKKNWEKLLKCHEDHFSRRCTRLTHCAVLRAQYHLSQYICDMYAFYLTCWKILIYPFDVSLYCWNRIFSAPFVQILLTLNATSSVWRSAYRLRPRTIFCKCPFWWFCNVFTDNMTWTVLISE